MDPAQEAEAAAVLQRLSSDPQLWSLAEVMAEIEQLHPAGQCAVLDHDYPAVWTVAVDQGSAIAASSLYYSRTCPRCGSIQVTNGQTWPA